MQETIDTFNERIQEIDLYYAALNALYEDETLKSDNDKYNKKYFNGDFLKILKSNALLMIYNLVESTIMGGIIEIYDELQQEGITYQQVRQEIQKIWFRFKFNEAYDKQAHYNTYREKAERIRKRKKEDVEKESKKKNRVQAPDRLPDEKRQSFKQKLFYMERNSYLIAKPQILVEI